MKSDAKYTRSIRKQMGLTQQEFGVKLGFSQGGANVRISEIENGKAPLSKKTRMIMEALIKKEVPVRKKSGGCSMSH